MFLKITCPYCLETQRPHEALYRCQALPQVCPPLVDSVYNDYFYKGPEYPMGQLTSFPKKWRFVLSAMRGIMRPAPCHVCATPTTDVVCHNCHGQLHHTFYGAHVMPILVVGEERSQFEAYMATLRAYLKIVGGHDLSATFEEAPEANVFTLRMQRSSLKKTLVFSFFFVPFRHLKAVSALPWFSKIKGAMVLLDMKAVVHAPTDPSYREKIWRDFETCANFSLFKKAPVAFVFSPRELLMGLVPKGNVLHRPGLHMGGYNRNLALYKMNEMMAHLGAWCGANVLRQMKDNFKRYFVSVVSLSSLSHEQRLGETHIEEPFVWLLYMWGILKVVDVVEE
jgi:hypothetical protein